MSGAVLNDDQFDQEADEIIKTCLNLQKPNSFFLYAGAGSGKTRSLVKALNGIDLASRKELASGKQQVAVITYTNAACDEIKQRLSFDPLVDVRTIHSFAWLLIEGFNHDIRIWLDSNLRREIADLEDQQARGRASKASQDRARAIVSKNRRLESLPRIASFIYSPTGENRQRDALNHSEVLAITAQFLRTKANLKRMLVARYPILLIDESQDTVSSLMDAFLHVESEHRGEFCLGLLGDTMQRIYADGKTDLVGAIPPSWARPEKVMNHRCPKRVIELINQLRVSEDGRAQRPRSDAPDGNVRLFILPEASDRKVLAEADVRQRMADITSDLMWTNEENVKTLTLEHHMAARRFGFVQLFDAIYPVQSLRTGFLDGTSPAISLFTKGVLPLVQALDAGDKFKAAAIVRERSPLLDRKRLADAGERQLDILQEAKDAADSLYSLCSSGDANPSLQEILQNVWESGLFAIPESLMPFVTSDDPEPDEESGKNEEEQEESAREDPEESDRQLVGWRTALEAPFDQLKKYDEYTRGDSAFDTHQGVKGLEFPRVMVVISDDEARGFLFSFGKLFGEKEMSSTDLDHERAGRENTLNRTLRLFYVICSRAKSSLAIVYYSSNPAAAARSVMGKGWFRDDEVETHLPENSA